MGAGPVSEGEVDGILEGVEFEVSGDAEDGIVGSDEGVEVIADVIEGDEFEVFEFAFGGVAPGCWVGVLAEDFSEFLPGFIFDGDESLRDEVARGFEFVGGEVWFADHPSEEWEGIKESVGGGGGGDGEMGGPGLNAALEPKIIECGAEISCGAAIGAAVEHFTEDGGGTAAFGEIASTAGGDEQ
ncbi:MAG: hypothetical protein RL215_3440 [Planctomycetota bacterium]